MPDTHALLTMAQMLLGSVAAAICICRLNVLRPVHVLRYRLGYSAMLTAAVAGGFGPWMFPDTRGMSATAVLAAFVLHLWLTAPQWRCEPPAEASRFPSDAGDTWRGSL